MGVWQETGGGVGKGELENPGRWAGAVPPWGRVHRLHPHAGPRAVTRKRCGG